MRLTEVASFSLPRIAAEIVDVVYCFGKLGTRDEKYRSHM